MMLPLTKIPGVPDKRTVRPGMAFYSGSGPDGTTCGDCQHRGYARSGEWYADRCEKFRTMTGKNGPPVRTDWPSCKYFHHKEERQ